MGQSWPCLWEAGPTVMHSTKQVTWNKGQKGLQQKTCFQSCLLVFQFLACLPERQMFYLRDLWCSLSMRKRWLTQTLWLSRYHLQLDGQVLPLSSYLKLFSISSFLGGLKSTFCFVCLFAVVFEMGCPIIHVVKTSWPPTQISWPLVSQSAGIKGMQHYTWLLEFLF